MIDNFGAAPVFQVLQGNGSYFDRSGERLYLTNFDTIGAPYGETAKPNLSYAASECALWMCIQVYNTSVVSTVQQQEVVAIYDSFPAGSTKDPVNLAPIPFPNYDLPGQQMYGPNYTIPGEQTLNGTTYILQGEAILALQQSLTGYLNATGYVNTGSPSYGGDLVRGIWNGTGNPEYWINNLASSMTTVVRANNASLQFTIYQSIYGGIAYELGVRVRWIWISLPAVVVGLSILLLVAVMVRTAHSAVQPWKSNPLVLLLLGLNQQLHDVGIVKMDDHAGVEKAVGDEKVKLQRAEDGRWELKSC